MNTIYPNIKNLSTQLLVADLEGSIDFYCRYLGFEVDFRYEDFYAGIVRGGHSIHLKSGVPTAAERTNKLKNQHLDLVFAVEDIQPFFEAIKNLPITIVQPLREMPYGHEFYIVDPDGYILGFME